MRDDPRRLRAIQTHAEALARAIEAIPADDPLHGLECWPWRTVRLPSPAELRAVADAAGGLLLVEKAIGGRGKRDRGPLVQRQALINALWDDYPAPLRSLALRGHFLESLGLILLGRRAGDPALRALQAEARRAREAVAAMALFHAEWLARSEPIT
jgi:hypothetical protein